MPQSSSWGQDEQGAAGPSARLCRGQARSRDHDRGRRPDHPLSGRPGSTSETADAIKARIDADEALARERRRQCRGQESGSRRRRFRPSKAAEIKPSADLKKFVDDLIADPDAWGEEPEGRSRKTRSCRFVRSGGRRSRPGCSWRLRSAECWSIAGGALLYMLDQQNKLTDQDRDAR